MATLFDWVATWHEKIFVELSDQRTIDWPLMRYPYPVLGLILLYLWIATSAGPRFMKGREPYEIRKIIQYYNLLQVLFCGVGGTISLFYFYGPWGAYSLRCEPIDYGDSAKSIICIQFMYGYFLLKLFDLFDTFFFILRKKSSHVSFLHVYHHAVMVLVGWAGLRFVPGGHVALVGILNTLVHFVMYYYYYLSSKDLSIKNSLWWKKYLTLIQIAQFAIVLVHNGQAILNPHCNYPKIPLSFLTPQSIVFLYLFSKFYKTTYMDNNYNKKSKKSKKTK